MNRIAHRLRNVLRRETRDILQGDLPTVELLRPVGPDVPSDDQVFQVLDLCLQVGEVLLSSGEAAADTAATMAQLAGACGLPTVEIDITFTSITMCCRRGVTVAPVTSMRLVRYRTTDLTRLAAVAGIVSQVTGGKIDVGTANAALMSAVGAPHPYPRWFATAGWAGLAAAVALLLGGGPVSWLTAFAITAVVDRVGRLLSRWGVAPFFLQLVGGFVATGCTLALSAVGALPPATEPALVIAASITVLLSGLSVMGAVQDAISGHPVTAAGRAAETALLSAGLLAGVILGLKVGARLDLTLDPAEAVAPDITRFGVSMCAAAIAAAMYAVAGYAPLRSLTVAGLTGGLGWAAYGALTLAQVGPVVATGLAAVVIGLASELLDRGSTIDRHVIILSGIIPLLPGLTAYRGFYQLASATDVVDGLVTTILALAIALALAAGVTLGQFLGRVRPNGSFGHASSRAERGRRDGRGTAKPTPPHTIER